MFFEEDHRRSIKDCTVGDHIQEQILDVVYEVQGHDVNGTNEVPDIN